MQEFLLDVTPEKKKSLSTAGQEIIVSGRACNDEQ